MRRVAALWLVVGLGALAAGCACGAQRAQPDPVNTEPAAPSMAPTMESEDEGKGKKAVESVSEPVRCEALKKEEECEAPCFWDKGALKCSQELGAVMHERGTKGHVPVGPGDSAQGQK